jgi:hypothetical protein
MLEHCVGVIESARGANRVDDTTVPSLLVLDDGS